MAAGALKKRLQRVGRTQLQEFVQSLARALGPRGSTAVDLEVGSQDGVVVPDSDVKRERIERSVSATSSGAVVQVDSELDVGENGGYANRREAARARRMRKQVQYMESVLVTGGAVSAEASESRRRMGSVLILNAMDANLQTSREAVVVIDHYFDAARGEGVDRKRIVPLETSRAGVSDSILKGHFHLPPPWGAGTARPLNRKHYSTQSCISESSSWLVPLPTQSACSRGTIHCVKPLSLGQLRGLAAKAKQSKVKKGKGGKGPKVAWDQDEETGEAVEVGGAGGSDVDRAEPDFDVEGKMEAALLALQKEFGKLRTGRASPETLDHVVVEAYGTPTPLNRVGTVSVLSPQMLSITPFDQNLLKSIEKGVRASPMELNPQSEGSSILVPIPPLLKDVRQNMIKVVTKAGENIKTSVRRVRKEALDSIKKQEEGMPKDEVKRQEKKVDELTKLYVKKVDEACRTKEKQILEG